MKRAVLHGMGAWKLTKKFLVSILVVLAFVTAVMVAVLGMHQKGVMTGEQKKKGDIAAAFLAGISAAPLLAHNAAYLENYARDSARDEDVVSVVIQDRQGNPVTHQAEKKQGSKNLMEFTAPIMQNNERIGLVKLAYSTNHIEKSLREAQLIILSVSLSMMAVISLVVYLLFRVIALRPIEGLQAVMARVASGDLSRALTVNSQDELGELGRSTNKMAGDLKSLILNITHTSAKTASAAEQIASSSRQVREGAFTTSQASEETLTSMEEMAASIQSVAKNADALSVNVQETSSSVTQMMSSVEAVARNMDSLSSSVTETSSTVEEMTVTTDQVAKNMEMLATTVVETSSTVEEMTVSIEQVAKGAENLSQVVRNAATSVEGLAASVDQVGKHIHEAGDISQRSVDEAKVGGEALSKAFTGMKNISGTMSGMASVIQNLGKSSREIGKIVDVIDEIADQTNLLALNAAIEAARAGDAGRGFAVVADEVRKLAERSMKATREIGEVINRVQEETEGAVRSTETGAREAAEAMDMADRAAEALKKIIEGVEKTGQIMGRITAATAEQTAGGKEVLKYVDDMRLSSEHVNHAMSEQAAGGKQIRTAVENMNQLTQQIARAVREQAVGGRQIRTAVESMNRIMQEVSQATREQAAGSKQIVGAVESMNRMTQQVSIATSEQKRGGDLVVRSTENISGIAKENLAAVEQMAKSAEGLLDQAEELQYMVSYFRTHADGDRRCWEILGCPDASRQKCPAHESDEHRCWLIAGTWCKGVQQGNARAKLRNCMTCNAYKIMMSV